MEDGKCFECDTYRKSNCTIFLHFRRPFHVALEQGLPWESTKHLLFAFQDAAFYRDCKTKFSSFQLAAVGERYDVNVVFILLKILICKDSMDFVRFSR